MAAGDGGAEPARRLSLLPSRGCPPFGPHLFPYQRACALFPHRPGLFLSVLRQRASLPFPDGRTISLVHASGVTSMPGVSLRSVPLFRGLGPEEIAPFAEAATEVTFAPGEVLLVSGEPANALYYVVTGEITARVLDSNRMPVMVSVIAPGHMAGWSALIPPHVATATLTALTELRTIRLDGARLAELCELHPRLGLVIMRNLGSVISERLASTRSRLATALDHVRSR